LWVSIKPLQYNWLKDQDIYVQVLGQILFLEFEYLEQLKGIPAANKIFVSYDEVCNDAEAILNKVKDMMKAQNVECKMDLSSIIPFQTVEVAKSADSLVVARLEAAYAVLKSRFPYLDPQNTFSS
jgi:hypothetical protein